MRRNIMGTKLKTALIALFFSLCGIAQAETVTVLPFAGESVHPQIRSAARDALSIFLTDNGVNVVGNKVKGPVQDGDKASEIAKSVGAQAYVQGKITRLGRRAIVQVTKTSIGAKLPSFADRMTAASPSDLETVMQRLARGVATGKKAVKNEDIHTVTEREQHALKRRVANQYFGLTLGGRNSFGQSTGFMPGFGFSWLWDNRNVLLGSEVRFAGVGTESFAWDIALAGYYPFTQDDTTPYVGGGLSLGGLQTQVTETSGVNDEFEYRNNQEEAGMNFFVAAGLLIGRTSTVSIRPEIAYDIGTYTLDDSIVHGVRFGLTLGF
jgi:hypothetical protein